MNDISLQISERSVDDRASIGTPELSFVLSELDLADLFPYLTGINSCRDYL